MPVYRYKAVNASGGVAVGELEAANEAEIVDRLRDQGLMPMQVDAAMAAAALGATAAGAAPGARRRWFAPRRVTRDHLLRSPASSRRCCARDCRSIARSRS